MKSWKTGEENGKTIQRTNAKNTMWAHGMYKSSCFVVAFILSSSFVCTSSLPPSPFSFRVLGARAIFTCVLGQFLLVC